MSKIYPYGGFWKRFAAFLLDTIILSIPFMLLFSVWMYHVIRPVLPLMATMTAGQQPNAELIAASMKMYGAMSLFQLMSFVAFWLYYAFMESSRYQATLGKMVLGLKVVGEQGQRISFWHATGRTLSKLISSMIIYIGFLMAGATKRKQALHDIIASTYVVDKTYQEGQPLPEVETHFVLFGLSILGMLILCLLPFVLAALFAINMMEHYPAKSAAIPMQQSMVVQPNYMQPISLPETPQQQNNNILDRLSSLKQLSPEQKQPFTENDYAFTFEDNGTVRAQHTDNDYALLMRPDENWPCCQPLVPDGCAEVTDVEVCQAK